LNLGGLSPTIRLRQGPAPAQWMTDDEPEPGRGWRPSPTGLVLFGGGGFASVRDTVDMACGNVTPCDGDSTRGAYTVGAAYWFAPFVAAEATYLRPAEVTVSGSGDGFRFNSFLDAHVLTVAGKGGVPIGPVRLYGQIGMNYSRASFGTTQTADDATVTVDDVTVTIPGGTQSYEIRTRGWGWMFGGGMEAWVTNRFAIYGEVARAGLEGSPVDDDAEGALDEGLTSILVGVRVKIWR
jgi:hypothetical protein